MLSPSVDSAFRFVLEKNSNKNKTQYLTQSQLLADYNWDLNTGHVYYSGHGPLLGS